MCTFSVLRCASLWFWLLLSQAVRVQTQLFHQRMLIHTHITNVAPILTACEVHVQSFNIVWGVHKNTYQLLKPKVYA